MIDELGRSGDERVHGSMGYKKYFLAIRNIQISVFSDKLSGFSIRNFFNFSTSAGCVVN